MVTITEELANELDAIRLSLSLLRPDIEREVAEDLADLERQLAEWMARAGFPAAFGMEWLP